MKLPEKREDKATFSRKMNIFEENDEMETPLIFSKDENSATVYMMKIFNSPVDRIWNHFTQGPLLDLWWAPLPWKCETKEISFVPGGFWKYAMISPEDEQSNRIAKFNEINHHRSFDYLDYFTDKEGKINTALPVTKSLIGFTGVEEGTKLTINIHFNSAAEMKQVLEMGMQQRLGTALSQLEQHIKEEDRF